MPNFHRYHAPSWLDADPILPGTTPTTQPNGKDYLFFNVNDGGDTGDGAAMAYGQVPSGTNQYTFMVGLREDAVSFAFNRGLKALAENTDFLDDLLNEDRVQPHVHAFSLGAPTSTISIPEGAYLGAPGTTLTASELRKLFRLVDIDLGETMDAGTESPVLAQSSSVAVSPDPPYTGPGETLTLTHTLPSGTRRLLYYRKSSLALAGRELLRSPSLASHMSATGVTQSLFLKIKGDGLSWDADPPVSLNTLALRGLNGTYRNSFTDIPPHAILAPYYPDYLEPTIPGNGFFHRDGPAMHGLSRTNLLTATPLKDPFGAVWAATVADTNLGDGNLVFQFASGSRGFVFVGRRPRVHVDTAVSYAPALGAFSAYAEHFDTFPVSTASVRTKIDFPAAATVQRVAGEDRITVSGWPGNFFAKTISGTLRTSLVRGWTLIEVEWTNPADPINPSDPQRRIYRIVSGITTTSVVVTAQDGSQANFPSGSTAATITRIFTPWFEVLDGAAELQYVKSNPWAALLPYGSMVCVGLPDVTQFAGNRVPSAEGAYFGASSTGSSSVALAWGGFESDVAALSDAARYRRTGRLNGDGSLNAVDGSFSNLLSSSLASLTTLQSSEITASTSITTEDLTATGLSTLSATLVTSLSADLASVGNLTINRVRREATVVPVSGAALSVSLVAALTDSNIALVVSSALTSISTITFPSFGSNNHFLVVFDHSAGHIQMTGFTGVWPASCVFEDPTDAMLSGVTGAVDVYECNRVGTKIYMKVRRYIP